MILYLSHEFMNAQPLILLLGSNQGKSAHLLKQARNRLEQELGQIQAESSVYQSKAWGNTRQPDFLNQVLIISYEGLAADALKIALDTERQLGRIRKEKWGARTMDIDLLYLGQQIIHTPDLTLPHPALHVRRFTLVPLVEIAPDFVHPLFKKSQKELLDICEDNLKVIKLSQA